jgi:glycosyltransferase involved in cell wall biosynthesis
MNDRSALFISTFNEIEALPKQFPRIPISAFDEVYALDGGSTDGTLEFYEENGIEVIKPVKKGAIFNAGAMTTECEYLVFFAPDGNESPDDIVRLLNGLKDGSDMVIASRFMDGGKNEDDKHVFRWRKWVSWVFNVLVHFRWGGHITDTINGFRAVRRSKLIEMNPEPTGFDIEFQMSIRALKLGHKVSEIATIEADRLGGQSAAYSLPTGWLILKRYLKEFFTGVEPTRDGKLKTTLN